jgi:hypothetical protein
VKHFRPLEFEALFGEGGFHDGVRAAVELTQTSDAMVSMHENVHSQVFTVTTDGIMLRSALLRSSELNKNSERRDLFRRVAEALLAESRAAHESVATYLGIKGAPPELHQRWLARLGSTYTGYYEAIADVLDAAFPVHTLQLLLAWNAALVVFCSPLLQKAMAEGWTFVLRQKSLSDASDNRLRALIRGIDSGEASLKGALRDWFRRACRDLGLEPWDMDSDGDWHSAGDSAFAVQHRIAPMLQRWLAEAAGLTFLVDPERSAVEAEFRKDSEADGFPVHAPDSAEYIPGTKVTVESWLVADAQMQSRITNAEAIPPPRGNPDLLENEELISSQFSFVISVREDSEAEGFDVLSWIDGASPDVQPATNNFALQHLSPFLSRVQSRESSGRAAADIVSVVVPVHQSGDVERWTAMFRRAREETLSAVNWYWLGSWSALAQFLIDGRLPAARFHVTHPSRDLHALFFLTHVGVVFRCLSGAALAAVDEGTRIFFQPHHIRQLEAAEVQECMTAARLSVLGVVPIRFAF